MPTAWPARLTKPEDRPGSTELQDRPRLTEPEGRVLLPEPPERPLPGMRQVPAFRGRRTAGDRYAGESADKDADGQTSPLPSRGSGWTIISYLIAGLLAYGGIGWLVSRAVHTAVIFPVGMLFGLGISLAWSSIATAGHHPPERARQETAARGAGR